MPPVVLVGEAFGRNEARLGVGFIGGSGAELLKMLWEAKAMTRTSQDYQDFNDYYRTANSALLNDIWLRHPEFYRTNVFNLHPPGDDLANFCGEKREAIHGYPKLRKGFISQEYIPELNRLANEIHVQNPNIIVCLGDTALWALTGSTGIGSLRGTTRTSTHTAIGYKLIATYHPAGVMRQWELRTTVVLDLTKAMRESHFPEVRRPKREIWIEPNLTDIEEFISRYVLPTGLVSVDIETHGNQITCIGLSPSPSLALVVPFFDPRRKDRSYWPSAEAEAAAWRLIARVLGDHTIRKVFQNGLYDIAFLYRSMGIKVYGAEHDTMLLHHALSPESLKALGYLGSLYTDEGPWKIEGRGSTTIKRDQ
jgi:uracil-DNA glycosylase